MTFSIPVNGARGEVALRIGNVDLVIAAEMARLSSLSIAMGYPALAEFHRRILGLEISTAMLAIRHLAILGDVDAALVALRLSHLDNCSNAFVAALNHHFDGEQGKSAAAPGSSGRRRKTKASRSATG